MAEKDGVNGGNSGRAEWSARTIKVGGRYRREPSGWVLEDAEDDGQKREGSEDGLNQVHMSPKRACHRLAVVYLPCIHMQIPIDMTTFTYCIFALGHILARQFPIVGFRPPVRLIDIIGRAADTRLHFYLHTFADQFHPRRPPSRRRTRVFHRPPQPASRGRRFSASSARTTHAIAG